MPFEILILPCCLQTRPRCPAPAASRWQGSGRSGIAPQASRVFVLHSVLGVRWAIATPDLARGRRPAGEVVGLCDQQYSVRKPSPRGTPKESLQARQYRARKSCLWEQAGQHLGPAPAGAQWSRTGEREADISVHLRSCQGLGHGVIMRAAKDRACIHSPPGPRAGRVFAGASGLPRRPCG